MKLIIDIDNEAYKGLVTEDHIFVKHIFDSVKNGIPLEQIRDEIEQMRAKPDNMVKLIGDFISIDYVLGVINKYMEDKNER